MDEAAEESGGYALVQQGNGNEAQAISFKIISTNTDSIRVGMVLPDVLLKNTSYFL